MIAGLTVIGPKPVLAKRVTPPGTKLTALEQIQALVAALEAGSYRWGNYHTTIRFSGPIGPSQATQILRGVWWMEVGWDSVGGGFRKVADQLALLVEIDWPEGPVEERT